MKIVVDTNVLLVIFFRNSKYFWLYQGIRNGKFEVILSNEIVTEYEEIISSFYSPQIATAIIEEIINLVNVHFVNPHFKFLLIHEDFDDNKFVDAAIIGNADYIITHDNHFNVLKTITFPKVNVVNLLEFKEIISN